MLFVGIYGIDEFTVMHVLRCYCHWNCVSILFRGEITFKAF